MFLTSTAAYDVAVLLSLLLYKVGDPGGETREEALLMLRCVATMEWGHPRGGGAPAATPPTPVMGDLSDSYSRSVRVFLASEKGLGRPGRSDTAKRRETHHTRS